MQQHAPQGGLAAAGLANHPQGFPLINVKADVIDGVQSTRSHRKILFQVLYLQNLIHFALLNTGNSAPSGPW